MKKEQTNSIKNLEFIKKMTDKKILEMTQSWAEAIVEGMLLVKELNKKIEKLKIKK